MPLPGQGTDYGSQIADLQVWQLMHEHAFFRPRIEVCVTVEDVRRELRTQPHVTWTYRDGAQNYAHTYSMYSEQLEERLAGPTLAHAKLREERRATPTGARPDSEQRSLAVQSPQVRCTDRWTFTPDPPTTYTAVKRPSGTPPHTLLRRPLKKIPISEIPIRHRRTSKRGSRGTSSLWRQQTGALSVTPPLPRYSSPCFTPECKSPDLSVLTAPGSESHITVPRTRPPTAIPSHMSGTHEQRPGTPDLARGTSERRPMTADVRTSATSEQRLVTPEPQMRTTPDLPACGTPERLLLSPVIYSPQPVRSRNFSYVDTTIPSYINIVKKGIDRLRKWSYTTLEDPHPYSDQSLYKIYYPLTMMQIRKRDAVDDTDEDADDDFNMWHAIPQTPQISLTIFDELPKLSSNFNNLEELELQLAEERAHRASQGVLGADDVTRSYYVMRRQSYSALGDETGIELHEAWSDSVINLSN